MLLVFFIIVFLIIIGRIVQCQFVNSKKYSIMANSQYSYKEDIRDTNFMLFDSSGKQLLDYKDKYYVVLVPELFSKNAIDIPSEELLTFMYILKNYNSDYDLSKIAKLSNNQKLYLEIDKITYEKMQNIKNIKGCYCYRCSSVDSNEVGKIENMIINHRRPSNNSLKSEGTIEMEIYNKTKGNKKPEIVFPRDVDGKITEGKVSIYDANINVRTTLNKEIQEKIKQVLAKNKFKQTGAVVMESSTGKILGMAQKEDGAPNVNLGVATSGGFYPGSIFKVIVEEAGIDRGILKDGDTFVCRGLYEDKHKNHGKLSVQEALIESCNDIFAQIGAKVGVNNFYEYANAQGLFSKVLNFDAEVAGKKEVASPKIEDGTLSLASIGQSIRITPVEALSIVNTVANGGNYVKPYLIDAYVDEKNNDKEKMKTDSRNITSKETSNTLKAHMMGVVNRGTGQAAYMQGVEVGGKTGTTQRIESSNINPKEKIEHSDGWFIGFFKVYDKYYSMVVFVQDINTESESGGNTAAPIFREILKEIKDNLK